MLPDHSNSYYESFKRESEVKELKKRKSGSLLTDRGAYLSFLEVQLERVTSAMMTSQGYSDRIEELQTQVLQTDERVTNCMRMIQNTSSFEESQKKASQQHLDSVDMEIEKVQSALGKVWGEFQSVKDLHFSAQREKSSCAERHVEMERKLESRNKAVDQKFEHVGERLAHIERAVATGLSSSVAVQQPLKQDMSTSEVTVRLLSELKQEKERREALESTVSQLSEQLKTLEHRQEQQQAVTNGCALFADRLSGIEQSLEVQKSVSSRLEREEKDNYSRTVSRMENFELKAAESQKASNAVQTLQQRVEKSVLDIEESRRKQETRLEDFIRKQRSQYDEASTRIQTIGGRFGAVETKVDSASAELERRFNGMHAEVTKLVNTLVGQAGVPDLQQATATTAKECKNVAEALQEMDSRLGKEWHDIKSIRQVVFERLDQVESKATRLTDSIASTSTVQTEKTLKALEAMESRMRSELALVPARAHEAIGEHVAEWEKQHERMKGAISTASGERRALARELRALVASGGLRKLSSSKSTAGEALVRHGEILGGVSAAEVETMISSMKIEVMDQVEASVSQSEKAVQKRLLKRMQDQVKELVNTRSAELNRVATSLSHKEAEMELKLQQSISKATQEAVDGCRAAKNEVVSLVDESRRGMLDAQRTVLLATAEAKTKPKPKKSKIRKRRYDSSDESDRGSGESDDSPPKRRRRRSRRSSQNDRDTMPPPKESPIPVVNPTPAAREMESPPVMQQVPPPPPVAMSPAQPMREDYPPPLSASQLNGFTPSREQPFQQQPFHQTASFHSTQPPMYSGLTGSGSFSQHMPMYMSGASHRAPPAPMVVMAPPAPQVNAASPLRSALSELEGLVRNIATPQLTRTREQQSTAKTKKVRKRVKKHSCVARNKTRLKQLYEELEELEGQQKY